MSPVLSSELVTLERRATRAPRPDLLPDIAHAAFILEYVCEQLDAATTVSASPSGDDDRR
jgi:hypothetical protein